MPYCRTANTSRLGRHLNPLIPRRPVLLILSPLADPLLPASPDIPRHARRHDQYSQEQEEVLCGVLKRFEIQLFCLGHLILDRRRAVSVGVVLVAFVVWLFMHASESLLFEVLKCTDGFDLLGRWESGKRGWVETGGAGNGDGPDSAARALDGKVPGCPHRLSRVPSQAAKISNSRKITTPRRGSSLTSPEATILTSSTGRSDLVLTFSIWVTMSSPSRTLPNTT